MKNKIYALALFAVTSLAACQKESVAPVVEKNFLNKDITPASSTVLKKALYSDTTHGYMRIQFAEDSFNVDNILLDFNPTAKTTFSSMEDAPDLMGFAQLNLASFSSDGIALAINTEPLSTKGLSVNLRVLAQNDGQDKLNLTTIQSVPENFDIWLKDAYKKDSLDFRHYPSYAFNIIKSDTNSFGSHRFSVVMRAH